MKYIQKVDTPQFFLDKTSTLNKWDEFKGIDKRELKTFILDNEQNHVCCYCEGKVKIDSSHLEHIKPKSFDPLHLTFDYQNIAVSCNGICNNEIEKEYCGHKKENMFDEEKFLNPTQEINIREYFSYKDDGKIESSGLNNEKALYTRDLLQLNTFNNYLQEARIKALIEFRNAVGKIAQNTGKDLKDIARTILNQEKSAYISFLRYRYKNILKENN